MTKKEEDTINKTSVNTIGTVEPTVVEQLLKKVEDLERRDEENQKKLTMLAAVADKGRVFNYESNQVDKKPVRVKLSVFGGGLIVGWRTLKDELIKHPSTGAIVGEEQAYEILVLDKEDKTTKVVLGSYPAFSDARYSERIEAEVVSKKEGWDGSLMFDLKLEDGRVITLDARFVN